MGGVDDCEDTGDGFADIVAGDILSVTTSLWGIEKEGLKDEGGLGESW